MKSKSDATGMLVILFKRLENTIGTSIKTIVSDNGSEFKSRVMKDFCAKQGIQHLFTVPQSSLQNGSVERSHRVDTEAAICLLNESKLPKRIRTYAMMFSCYTRNRALSKSGM
jgi:transposase InsO family protein